MTQLPALSPAERAATVERQRIAITCTATVVCVRVCVVFAIYDNNILPRLIMIIIKMLILYFIQIRHTDDFPSTGTRLVNITHLKNILLSRGFAFKTIEVFVFNYISVYLTMAGLMAFTIFILHCLLQHLIHTGLSHEHNMQKMRLLTFMQMAEERQEIYFDTIQQEMNLTPDDIEAYIIEGGTGQSFATSSD